MPEAEFADGQGDFPVSMYFQGLKDGQLPVEIEEVESDAQAPAVAQNGDVVRLLHGEVSEVAIYSYDGKFLYGRHTTDPEVSLVGMQPGIYLVNFTLTDGDSLLTKIVKN